MKELYSMLDKRKSVRTIDKNNLMTEKDLQIVKDYLDSITPLYSEIPVKWKIVEAKETNSKIGEYEVLIYSKKSECTDYLLNIGYMFEKADLFFEKNNIGVCWLGIPRPKDMVYEGLDYVIMLGLSKISENDLRTGIDDFKRKKEEKLWCGEFNEDVISKSLLAPSACNSQSWIIEKKENVITVYRNKHIITIIPKSRLDYFNSMDLGIYLCFLEVALLGNGYDFERKLINKDYSKDKILIAEYILK